MADWGRFFWELEEKSPIGLVAGSGLRSEEGLINNVRYDFTNRTESSALV